MSTGKGSKNSLINPFTPVIPSRCSAAGISRSVTITVVYMMTVSEFNFEECLTAVRACREVANPNYGFRLQLKQYEEGKMAKVSVSFCKYERVSAGMVYLTLYIYSLNV